MPRSAGEIVLRLCYSRPNDFSIDEILLESTSETHNDPSIYGNAHRAKIFNEARIGKKLFNNEKETFCSKSKL